jgi:hypothetical protein
MRHISHCLLFALFCTPLLMTAQSPWARDKNGGYVQAGYHFIPTYQVLFGENNTDINLPSEVSERQIQLYGEYGISNRTTVAASLPFVFNSRADGAKLSSLGNSTLALRHQFLRGKIALAGTLRVALPSSAVQAESGLRTGFDALTIQPMVSAGIGFGRAYGFVYGGYGYRTNDFSDVVNAGVEAGVHLWKIWLAGFSEFVGPVQDPANPNTPPDLRTGLYIDQQGWLSVGLKASLEINRFVGITLSGAGAAWAQNVPKSPGIGLGVFVKWN